MLMAGRLPHRIYTKILPIVTGIRDPTSAHKGFKLEEIQPEYTNQTPEFSYFATL